MEWVVKHMGHTLDVHKIYYRCTSDVVERTQIAKILLLQDSGKLTEFMNKSLDEIQSTDLVDSEEVEPDELDELMDQFETMAVGDDDGEEAGFGNDVDPAMAVDFNETTHTKEGTRSKRRSRDTKQKWTLEEEEEIKTLFQTFFDQKVRPLGQIEECWLNVDLSIDFD